LQQRTILLLGLVGEAGDAELVHRRVGGGVCGGDGLQHLAAERPPRLLVQLLDRAVQLRGCSSARSKHEFDCGQVSCSSCELRHTETAACERSPQRSGACNAKDVPLASLLVAKVHLLDGAGASSVIDRTLAGNASHLVQRHLEDIQLVCNTATAVSRTARRWKCACRTRLETINTTGLAAALHVLLIQFKCSAHPCSPCGSAEDGCDNSMGSSRVPAAAAAAAGCGSALPPPARAPLPLVTHCQAVTHEQAMQQSGRSPS